MINNNYQVDIQSALEQLQKNLGDLESAKSQINQAKLSANSVVDGMSSLQSSYQNHLNDLDSKIEGFLTQSKNEFTAFFEGGVEDWKKTNNFILNEHASGIQKSKEEVEAVQSNIQTLIDQQLSKNSDFLREMKAEQNAFVEQIKDLSKKELEAIQQESKTQLGEMHQSTKGQIDGLMNWSNKTMEDSFGRLENQMGLFNSQSEKSFSVFGQNMDLFEVAVKQSFGKLNEQIETVESVYQKQNDELSLFLRKYKELMGAVEKMMVQVSGINFPDRFDHLESKMDQNLSSQQAQLESFQSKILQNSLEKSQIMEQKVDQMSNEVHKMRMFLFTFMLAIAAIWMLYSFKVL